MKRIIALFLFTFFCFGLVACDLTSKNNTTEPTKENTVVEPGDKTNENSGYDFETVFNKVKALIPSEGVKDNINLPSAVGSVAFVWSSSDETVCTKNGVVTRGLEDKEVTLTALMIYGKEQATMSFTVTVLKTEETLNTISEVLNADMNSVPLPSFSVCGDVIALGGSSFLIKDETGMILVYRGYTWTHELEVGDKVLVSGTPTTYSNTVQFDSSATYTKVGVNESFEQPTSLLLAGSDCDKYKEELSHDYVTVTGTLAISGNYYNLSIPGASIKGSIVSPLVEDIELMNGKEVTVTGYILYLTGSGNYLNILATSVVGDTTPIEAKTYTVSEILASGEGIYETTATVCAYNAQSFLLTDGVSYILAYRGRNFSQDVEVGSTVKIEGQVTTYSNLLQFADSATYEEVSKGEYDQPNPVVLTAADCDEFKNGVTVTYAQVTGKLAISGNYINLNIDGASITGSIAYPIQDLSEFDGKYVDVVGYVLYTTGSGNYLNFMATSVTLGEEPAPSVVEEKTVTEILDSPLGEYSTTATVCAYNAQSFLITDGVSYILVYKGRDFARDVNVGDSVEVSGKITTYNNTKQFGTDCTYSVKGSGEFSQPNPRPLSGDDCDTLANDIHVEYVTVEGTLMISGNYVNLSISGANVVGSVAYPIEDLSELNDKYVKVTGYVLYTSGSTTKYLNIMATSVNEEEAPVVTIPTATVTEVVEGKDGEYECTATVSAIYLQGFLLTDGTNNVIVYRGRGWDCDVEVGDEVKIVGTVELYGKGKEFKNTATYEKTNNTNQVSFGEPTEFVSTDFESIVNEDQIVSKLITFDGLLVSSGDKLIVKVSNSLVNVTLLYPVDDYTELDNNYVKVVGFVAYADSTLKYLNVVAQSVELTDGEYIEPSIIISDDAVDGTDFNFEDTFDKYNGGWSSSYTFHEIKTYEMNYKEQYTIELSNSNKQSSTITTMPVCASKNTDQTITIIGDFTGASKVIFTLVDWNGKTFSDIHLEYTTDGENWISCSDVIYTPTAIETNVDISSAIKVRVVFNGGKTSNVQLGLQKITIVK